MSSLCELAPSIPKTLALRLSSNQAVTIRSFGLRRKSCMPFPRLNHRRSQFAECFCHLVNLSPGQPRVDCYSGAFGLRLQAEKFVL